MAAAARSRKARQADIGELALALPEVELGTSWGDRPSYKVRGKAFVSPGREPGSFHVMSPHDEKAVLLETDPDTFWQTPHYEGWPGLLVRYGSANPERVKRVIARAWRSASSAHSDAIRAPPTPSGNRAGPGVESLPRDRDRQRSASYGLAGRAMRYLQGRWEVP